MAKEVIPELRQYFEDKLEKHIRDLVVPIEMLKPMIYSLKNGGKRLRPLLVLTILYINGHKNLKLGVNTAIALEYIHTYSLIHDDLPAMDNDDLRRGQPTSHVKFDEATAILAGDALLTDAFGIVANDERIKPKQRVKLVALLSESAGSLGMVAGQLNDMRAEEQEVSYPELKNIHALKTSRLFSFATQAAGIILQSDNQIIKLLKEFAESFGLAYQIHNDLVDVMGTNQETGKARQSDMENNKSTYPSLLGSEKARQALEVEVQRVKEIVNELSELTDKDYSPLLEFLNYVNIKESDYEEGKS